MIDCMRMGVSERTPFMRASNREMPIGLQVRKIGTISRLEAPTYLVARQERSSRC